MLYLQFFTNVPILRCLSNGDTRLCITVQSGVMKCCLEVFFYLKGLYIFFIYIQIIYK